MHPATFAFFAFFLIFLLFVVFLPTPQARSTLPNVFLVIPFALFIAIFFLPGFVVGIWEASRARCLLTDRRAIIRGWHHEAEVDLATLAHLELRRSLLGTATIYFGQHLPWEGWMWGWSSTSGGSAPAFRAIPDGERVYRLVSEARAGLRQR